METVDYARLDYYYQHHHARYRLYVEDHGRTCQDCGGSGKHVHDVIDGLWTIYVDCGWCEGTGRWTRWKQGLWLRCKRLGY